MPWTRASELDRTLHCVGSLVLPRTEVKSERALEAADWGTMGHRWKATGEVRVEPGRTNHEKLFRERLERTALDRSVLWPEGGEHEVAVAINCVTGEVERFPGSAMVDPEAADAWKAAHDDRWVTGTLDYRHTIMGEPWVDDYKSGAWPVPVETFQLDGYGYADWVLAGRPEQSRVSITQWPRYPKDGLPWRVGRVITASEHQDFLNNLGLARELYLTMAGVSLSCQGNIPIDLLTPGEWCRFCPSRGECPAYDKDIHG